MDKNKLIAKIEQDLSFFMISEACNKDPSKRGSSELYRYKGLSVSTNEKAKGTDKVMSVRIGSLEAQFKIDTGDKVFGALMPDDERAVQIWMGHIENTNLIKTIFKEGEFRKKKLQIIPFDLEFFYNKN